MESNQFVQVVLILVGTLVFNQNLSMTHADHLGVNHTDITVNQTNQSCLRSLTYEQIKLMLEQHPCISAEDFYVHNDKSRSRRFKRWFGSSSGGGDNQINALSNIINDHRTMINYIMNTSVNATFVKDSIADHHESTGPNLRSWRDMFDIFCMTIFIGAFLYIIIFRCGFAPCNLCLISLSKMCVPPTQQKQEIQQLQEQIKKQLEAIQQQPHRIPRTEQQKIYPNRHTNIILPSATPNMNDIAQYNSGYISE